VTDSSGEVAITLDCNVCCSHLVSRNAWMTPSVCCGTTQSCRRQRQSCVIVRRHCLHDRHDCQCRRKCHDTGSDQQCQRHHSAVPLKVGSPAEIYRVLIVRAETIDSRSSFYLCYYVSIFVNIKYYC